jgi:hypothetical protein
MLARDAVPAQLYGRLDDPVSGDRQMLSEPLVIEPRDSFTGRRGGTRRTRGRAPSLGMAALSTATREQHVVMM